ncbi:hypothetical protein GOODEAATRI_000473 [Goodea atripinnis]|uniref:Uncharacterized protein n=1 Tax=Goodea atripinnis TaxID=208336 RepID=A0ABV0MN70_9TELE
MRYGVVRPLKANSHTHTESPVRSAQVASWRAQVCKFYSHMSSQQVQTQPLIVCTATLISHHMPLSFLISYIYVLLRFQETDQHRAAHHCEEKYYVVFNISLQIQIGKLWLAFISLIVIVSYLLDIDFSATILIDRVHLSVVSFQYKSSCSVKASEVC